MTKFLTSLMVLIGFAGVSSCSAQDKLRNAEVDLGTARIAIPAGWSKTDSDKERVNLESADGRQQATISLMAFDAAPTIADFKRICSHRLEAEKAAAPDVSIMDDPPFEDDGTFGMFFSGKEAISGRLFSGFVTQKGVEVFTIYVESIGVNTKEHGASFERFVKGFRWR